MSDPFWVQLAGAVQDWTAALAVVGGGAWALYRFGLRRENQTALEIGLDHECLKYGSNWLVSFDVTFVNKCAVRLGAKRRQKPAYSDSVEDLAYSVDLLLRPVPDDLPPGSSVRWFATDSRRSPQSFVIECDLAADYAVDNETDFWMEPGESYHLGSAVVLSRGTYLAMVSFVGDRDDREFWRRTFVVRVPPPQQGRRPDRPLPPSSGAASLTPDVP